MRRCTKMVKSKIALVIALLQRNRDGLTIIEIARELSISRNTVAVVLAELKGAQQIRIRPVGMAKLHYWQGNQVDRERGLRNSNGFK